MASQQSILRSVRLTHLYFGVFIAPALLFFGFTGFIQTFSLHETTRGSNYQPPRILVELGQLHKKQTLVLPERRPPAPVPTSPDSFAPGAPAASVPTKQHDAPVAPSPAAPTRPNGPQSRAKNLWPMKLFFALVSLGLVSSTLSGLYMAYKYSRNAKVITALWLTGILIPALFTFL